MVHEDGKLEISDISSSYYSDIFVDRHVPDLCGICGKLPYAQIILMPIQPAALFDILNGKRDCTKQDDDWFVSSGTSAAAAYVSGILANLLRIESVKKEDLFDLAKKCCEPIKNGKNFMGESATEDDVDMATGYGFVSLKNADKIIKDYMYEKEYS